MDFAYGVVCEDVGLAVFAGIERTPSLELKLNGAIWMSLLVCLKAGARNVGASRQSSLSV
jgi:hypothetical protein